MSEISTTPGDLVLAKTLRDGVTLVEIRIEPQKPDSAALAYYLRAYWDGEPSGPFQSSPVPLEAPGQGFTHAISLMRGTRWQPIALTAAEAGQVDQATRAWTGRRKAAGDAETAARETAARAAAPGAETWKVSGAYGYLAGTGKTVRLPDGRAVTALGFSSRYYAEDGMSFGAADDAGYVYFTEVRAATPAEEAALAAREEAQAARQDTQDRGGELTTDPDAVIPAAGQISGNLRELPGVRLEPQRRTLAFGAERAYRHLRVDEPGGSLWILTWNGSDGDDWSRSNHGSYIAARLPLTTERATLVAVLRDEFGTAD